MWLLQGRSHGPRQASKSLERKPAQQKADRNMLMILLERLGSIWARISLKIGGAYKSLCGLFCGLVFCPLPPRVLTSPEEQVSFHILLSYYWPQQVMGNDSNEGGHLQATPIAWASARAPSPPPNQAKTSWPGSPYAEGHIKLFCGNNKHYTRGCVCACVHAHPCTHTHQAETPHYSSQRKKPRAKCGYESTTDYN